MSEAHKGKTLSDEAKRKLIEANRGRVVSEETKRKISASKRGKTHRGKPVDMFTIDGLFIKSFQTAKEAAAAISADTSAISAVCRGKRKSAGGYVWRFHSEDIN